MTSMRRRFVVLACAVGAVTLRIGVGVASGKMVKPVSASVEVDIDQTGAATAECNGKQKVVSGGFDQPDFDPSFDEAGFQFYGSRREGGREWTASAPNYGEGASGTLTSYAYCRAGKGLKERSASVSITGPTGNPYKAGTATARCEQDEKVVSGGHDVPTFEIFDTEAVVYASRKKGKRSWTASAVSYSDATPTLTAYAYCRKGAGTKTKSKSTTIEAEPDTRTATAKCKKGQKVVSGGFDNPDFGSDIQLEPQILAYTSVKVGKRKWTASGFNNGNRGDPSGTGTFTVYAYCEKKKKKKLQAAGLSE
jgi:hypothetical protein